MVAIIDYNAGNLKSVEKAFAAIGQECVCTMDVNTILTAEHVVLPGVGAFAEAMSQIKKYELDKVVHEVVEKKTPLLGICLGLQLLFDGSEEGHGVEGLHVLKGDVLRIPEKEGIKVPHVGWNSLQLHNDGRLFRGIKDDSFVYFVHSYYLKAADESIVRATCDYSTCIHASVEKDNVFACQFHPEKSSETGLAILKNFTQIKGGN